MMKVTLTLVLAAAAVFFQYTQAIDTGTQRWNNMFERMENRHTFNEAVRYIAS